MATVTTCTVCWVGIPGVYGPKLHMKWHKAMGHHAADCAYQKYLELQRGSGLYYTPVDCDCPISLITS